MGQQIQKKTKESWGTLMFSSIWYIVFVTLILTTLIGLSILAVRIGREGSVEVDLVEVKQGNSSDPIQLMRKSHIGFEPPTQLDGGRLGGKGYIIPYRTPILYVAREDVQRTPDTGSGDGSQREKRVAPIIIALMAYGTFSAAAGVATGVGVSEAIHSVADKKVEGHRAAIGWAVKI